MDNPHTLPPELTIYTVGDLKGQCLSWVGEAATETHVEQWPVNASAVDQIDAAGVQLLVALGHTLAGQGQALALVQPTAALTQACAALGLADWLQGRQAEGIPT